TERSWNRRSKAKTRRIFPRQLAQPRDQAPHHPLLAKVQWLRLGERCRSRRVREANRDGYCPGRQQLQQVLRLQRLSGASHMANQVCNRAARCLQERARQLRQLNEANLMASQGCNRAARSRLEQAKRFRQLNEANYMANQACNRAARCLQERARQLRQLNEPNLMASPGYNRAARCRLEQARRFR